MKSKKLNLASICTLHNSHSVYFVFKFDKQWCILLIQWLAEKLDFLAESKDISLFQLSFQIISGSNDTSFESPYIGHLESAKKMGVASS